MEFKGRVVWIPCKIIKDEGKMKLVQPEQLHNKIF